jgi:long-chain acyl-CoA synthetase
VICQGETFTWTDIDRSSDALGRGLQEAGLLPGDRVAVFMDNSPDLVVTLFGIAKAGGAFVIVNPTTKGDKTAYVLNDCEARALVATSSFARNLLPTLDTTSVTTTIWAEDPPTAAPNAIPLSALTGGRSRPQDPGVGVEDLATIVYTSGSTGRPKGVMLTHRNLDHSTWSISTYLQNVPEDIVASALPLSFGYGLIQVLVGARIGYTTLLERSFAYPYDVMRRIANHRATAFPGVPSMFATILQMGSFEELDLSSIRYVTSAAAHWPPAHIRRIQARLPQARLFSMYGLTECTRVTYLDPDRLEDKIRSVGKAIPNMEADVVDEAGRHVPPGVVGELVVRGPGVMRGYWGKPDETAERLRDDETPGEKVLYTGDQFWMDDEGFLYFVGRKDDIFKSRGEKVSPKEIESVLYELETVAEAAVVGVPDPIDGSAIKAIVVAREGVSLAEQEVRLHCRKRLENHLVPKIVEVRSSLPKTDSGKIHRAALT